MKNNKLFSFGILAIILPLLSSCNSKSNEENHLFDYWWEKYCVGQGYIDEPEVIGTDKQGLEFSLMESGHCYAGINVDKLFTYANGLEENDVLIEVPASFKNHAVVGFAKNSYSSGATTALNEGKTLSFKLPDSIEYLGAVRFSRTLKAKLMGIPENVQYITSVLPSIMKV